MRLVSFEVNGRQGFGILRGTEIADLSHRWPTIKAYLAAGNPGDAIREQESAPRIPLEDVSLLPPVTDPNKIICVGLNYHGHAAEVGLKVPEYPSLFVRFPDAQVGHDQAVQRPAASEQFDFEGELAVVIGSPCRNVTSQDAMEHVAGYSCFADNSARDFQRHSSQVTAGKNFTGSGSFGPWIVSADELPDLAALMLTTRLNGIEVQHDSLSNLIFSVPELIEYISSFTELLPGDVIATGTPAGVGMGRTPPLFMKAGDVLEVEISGIGVLSNVVEDASATSHGRVVV